MAPKLRFLDILEALGRHGVEFIVVGGVAAVLEGAPITTFDLDIVPDPAPDNRERLLAALHELNARYLDPAGRCLTLGAVIESKEQAGRDKDHAALPILRRTLAQKIKRSE
jgi:hypothetical protein